MERTLTWLHLSDLHSRKWDQWDSAEVIAALVKDLRQTGLRPDFVFFTGDLVYGSARGEKISDQFEQAIEFLEAVRNAFDPPIEKNNLFLIPGNHDVDRDEITQGESDWLRANERTELEIINVQNENKKQWKLWMERLDAYRIFLKKYELDHLQTNDPHLIWAATRELHGLKVGIAGLNSAWSCSKSDEKSKIWSGANWQIPTLKSRLGDVDFTIGLIHHPANWFNHLEDPAVRRRLQKSFEIVLHGHEHQAFVETSPNGHVQVSGGACYNCSWMHNGYNFGKIDFNDDSIVISLRAWDQTGGGWVPRNVANHAPSGDWVLNDIQWIKDLSRDDQILNSSSDSVNLNQTEEPSAIISVSRPINPESLVNRISELRRRPLLFEPQHGAIRTEERYKFLSIYNLSRFIWLVADWQMGKEGFLADCINRIDELDALKNVFRIQCGDATSPEVVFSLAEIQLGMSFPEFAEIATSIPCSTLILDDLPQFIGNDAQCYDELVSKIKAILDFSPSLRIVVITRQNGIHLDPQIRVILKPLDVTGTSEYLTNHPRSTASLRDKGIVEQLHSLVGGLPTALDRCVSQSEYLSIADILKEDGQAYGDALSEAVPKALIDAVSEIKESTVVEDIRSYELLKLLTVLRDGETFKSISRFYHKMPFYEKDIGKLVKAGLVESILIAQTASELLPARIGVASYHRDPTRLIRVPRQVRDYVNGFVDDGDRSKIYHIASDSFFGQRWSQGSIKLRRSLYYAYQDSSISGPGNELIIAQFFLKSALDGRRQDRIDKYARLALGYCSILRAQDRFRDLVIAAGSIADMLANVGQDEHWATASYYYGGALRLTSQESKSIEVLENLRTNYKVRAKAFESSILFDLATAYKTEGDNAKAHLLALKIIELEEKDSALQIQARSLIAKIQLSGGKLAAQLMHLYKLAKDLGHKHAANNIALDLAKRGTVKKETLKYLDSVIKSSRDPYNRTRAITQKAKVLREQGLIETMSFEDREMLCSAYAYSYSQRISGLMDSSHDSLWELYAKSTSVHCLLRLFRFSSFVWRLGNRGEREAECLEGFISLDLDFDDSNHQEIEIELVYFEARKASFESTEKLIVV